MDGLFTAGNVTLHPMSTINSSTHPTIKIFETSCTRGTGLDDWTAWLLGKAAH